MFQSKWEVVHKSKTEHEAELVISQLKTILLEINELLHQRKALKKMKERNAVEGLIVEIYKKLRNDYFEIFIKDLISKT
ncbi:hypothetical protein QTG56_25715 (plasmid) [Rossellomorea sp. AcN35-11]|nr:hypothetical protein [Rossellomorea aquimaris]WJV32014.1 hypothetical protein QTG56_25715 [Rossellomorea sp. AcN35-11]